MAMYPQQRRQNLGGFGSGTAPLRQPGGFNPQPFGGTLGGERPVNAQQPFPQWQPPVQQPGGTLGGQQPVGATPGPQWQPPVSGGMKPPPMEFPPMPPVGNPGRPNAFGQPPTMGGGPNDGFVQSLPQIQQQRMRHLMGNGYGFDEAYRMMLGRQV